MNNILLHIQPRQQHWQFPFSDGIGWIMRSNKDTELG